MQATKEHVLCVVNDDEDCSPLLTALRTFEVTIVRSAAKALSLARDGGFDLYVMNSSLPNGTSYDLCRQLREFDAYTPVLFIKDADREDDRREVARAGAQGFFVSEDSLDGLLGVASRLMDVQKRVPED
jgi:DNA-binding response OmpR family regulator